MSMGGCSGGERMGDAARDAGAEGRSETSRDEGNQLGEDGHDGRPPRPDVTSWWARIEGGP